jgi:hypothetical protein
MRSIKEAPARALRAVFAGIGQLLEVADKIRKQVENRSAPPATPASQPVTAQPAGGLPRAKRSLDQTGNVRLLSAEDLADEPAPAVAEATVKTEPRVNAEPTVADATLPESEAAQPIEAEIAEPEIAVPGVAEPEPAEATASTADALPVPSYDSLSLPSLRARLRTLDTAQLRVLVEYEQSHAGRPDVIAMFERRIAKLAAGTPAAEG